MNKYLKSIIFRDFLKLFSGKVSVQVLALIFYPLLTRLYSPEEFGQFGVFQSSVVIFSVIVMGQLHQLLPNSRTKGSYDTALVSSLSYIFLLFTLLLSFFAVSGDVLDSYYSGFQLIIPFAVLFYSLNEVCKIYYISQKEYSNNSVFLNINRLSSNSLKLLFSNSLGLIYSEVIANFFSVTYLIKQKYPLLKGLDFNKRKILQHIQQHITYPTFLTIGTLATIGTIELPVFFLKSLFNSNVVGLYVVANKLSIQPFILLSGTLSSILHNKFVDEISEKGFNKRFYNKMILTLFLCGIPIVTTFNLFGPEIISFILGNKWNEIEPIISILSFMLLTKILYGPTLSYYLSRKKITSISLVKAAECLIIITVASLHTFSDEIIFLKFFVIVEILADVLIILSALISINIKIDKS